jgi:hypothetical protein
MRDESRDVADLTIGELLRRLRPVQIWAVGAAVVALIGGTFTLGQSLGQYRASAMEERLQLVESQEKFFVRYLRYLIAKDRLQRSTSTKSEQDFKLANDMFVRQIETWWTRQESFDGELELGQQIVRKGDDPTQSRVIFADETEWQIPPEIKRQVLERVEQ